MNALDSLKFFLPESFLLIGAFVALFLDLFVRNKKGVGILCLAILIGSGVLAATPLHASQSLFFNYFTLDMVTHYFRLLAIGVVAITLLASLNYQPLAAGHEGEYYWLFLFMTFGLILMASSTNLLMIFLSVEFVSILSYLLVGFLKKDARAKEAAVKYLLFGTLASGTMLYGMSLLFGATGSLELSVIQERLSQPRFFLMNIFSLLFFLAGLGFKISMAPFHMWAPDVYEGAPTPVTAFLTVAPKALGFSLLIRILTSIFARTQPHWQAMMIALSILTMTVGNVVAISQTNIKRLLAYSSIAQAGYILMGIASFNETGLWGVFLYLATYAFTNLGAFIVVIAVSNALGNDEIESYAGLAKRSPFLAASLAIFLLSLGGIPPFAGFIGKFFVFSSAVQGNLYALAIAAAVNSAVAAYYYFKVVRVMYLVPSLETQPIVQPAPLTLALCLMLAGVMVFGILPSPLIALVKEIFVL